MSLRADGIGLRLGGRPVLDGVTLEAGSGETVALLGPSGCGKTTLLRVLAGLQRVERGRVLLDGRDVTETPPHRRGVGLMFQDHALFPHRDVGANVAFGLRMTGVARGEIARRVADLLELVGLPGAQKRAVDTLSGGEQQRVALARALAPSPRVLLLDEPLGSLDRPLRERLLTELAELFDRLALTVVYVTHDVAEAFALGDRVALMRAGRIVQEAAPDELWAQPAGEWAARFLGLANVEVDGTVVRATRPEAIRVQRRDDGDAVVVRSRRSGPVVRLRVRAATGRELDAVVVAVDAPRVGERVVLEIDPAGVLELPRDGRVDRG